jgi:hypothetical protein
LQQGTGAIAFGNQAGYNNQGLYSISIGEGTQNNFNSSQAIAIGYQAGRLYQKPYTVAIGYQAGYTNQGSYAIAIGTFAGSSNQSSNNIVINASGITLNGTTASSCYISPIRNITNTNVLLYDTTNKEVTYDTNAPSASTVIITNDVADTTCFVPFVNNSPAGTAQSLKANNSLTYNSSTAQLGVPRIKPITIVDAGNSVGSAGQYLSTSSTGVNWVSLTPFTSQSFYLYNTTSFTPTLADTAQKYPLNTSSTIDYNSGFSASLTSDRITYNTITSKYFLINVTVQGGKTTSGAPVIGFEVRKNGTVIAGSARSQNCIFNGTQYFFPVMKSECITQLTNGQYIEVFCTTSTTSNWVTNAFQGYTPTGLNTVPTLAINITSLD